MTKRMEVYKCDKGITVEVLTGEACGTSCCATSCCELSCCGEPMELQKANTVDAAKEKHVPVLGIKECECGILVKVGTEPHPMLDKHSILWIEVVNGDYVNRKYLHPGEAPEAEFYVGEKSGITLRAYCNLHGLWESKI